MNSYEICLRNLADTLFLIEEYDGASNYYKILAKELSVFIHFFFLLLNSRINLTKCKQIV